MNEQLRKLAEEALGERFLNDYAFEDIEAFARLVAEDAAQVAIGGGWRDAAALIRAKYS